MQAVTDMSHACQMLTFDVLHTFRLNEIKKKEKKSVIIK